MNWPEDFVNKIICGDCLEVMKEMPCESVDAVITDPPYGVGFMYKQKEKINNPKNYGKWISEVFRALMRILKPGGFYAIWQASKYFRYFWDWFGDDIHIYAGCKNFVQINKIPINRGFDPIITGYKEGGLLCPEKQRRSVDFFVANTAKYVTEVGSYVGSHPCPRPRDQVLELIRNFAIEDGLIFDPFLGSGTTAEACKLLKRRFIGIEIDSEYCKIAEDRLRQGVL